MTRTPRVNNTVTNNLIWLVASLALGALVWIIAATQADPIGERRFPTIPVQMHPDSGLVMMDRATRNVRVTVRAQQSVLNLLTAEDIVVRADLRGLGPGTHTVELEAEVARRATVDTQPRQIGVTLEAMQAQQVLVDPIILNEPPVNYTRSQPVLSQTQVMISGPTSQVQKVVAARAPINLADRRDSLETEVRLLPVDAEGGVVSDVTLEPQTIGVSVAISRRDDVREVAVSPNIDTTTLPDGYVISSIGYAPQTVLVMTGSGPDSGSRIPNTLLTERIDLAGRTSDFEITVPVVFPSGEPQLPLLGDQVVTVFISITAQASTEQFEQILVDIIGLEDGLTAEIVPDRVSALVTGPQAVLESLTSRDVQVVLDLAGREPGTYELPPAVSIDQGRIEASGIALLPALVTVTIENDAEATAPPP